MCPSVEVFLQFSSSIFGKIGRIRKNSNNGGKASKKTEKIEKSNLILIMYTQYIFGDLYENKTFGIK